MRTLRLGLTGTALLGLAVLSLSGPACDDDGGNNDTGGSGGAQGTAGTGSGGDQGSAGAGGTSTGGTAAGGAGGASTGGAAAGGAGGTSTGGAGGASAGGSGGMAAGGAGGTSAGGSGGMAAGGMGGASNCPTVMVNAPQGAVWAIVKVNFVTDRVTLRNVSNAMQNTAGLVSCNRPAYDPNFGSGQGGGMVAAGADVTLPAGFALNPGSGEFGLYASTMYSNPQAMRAYVRWGNPANNRTDVAVQANLWPSNTATVMGTAEMGGLIAVGNTATPAGYRAVPANCL